MGFFSVASDGRQRFAPGGWIGIGQLELHQCCADHRAHAAIGAQLGKGIAGDLFDRLAGVGIDGLVRAIHLLTDEKQPVSLALKNGAILPGGKKGRGTLQATAAQRIDGWANGAA